MFAKSREKRKQKKTSGIYDHKEELIDIEVKKYLDLELEEDKVDPIKWWCHFGKHAFPFLYNPAIKFLTCSASR